MKVIVNPQDSVSLARIINTPARGIGDTSVNRIREEAIALQKTMWDIVAEDLLTGRVPKGLAGFREVMNKLISASHQVPQTLSLPDFATLVYEETGYKTMLAEEPGIESRSRQENIEEFINSIYEYAEENREADVNSFLQDISLMTTEENPENSDPESTITLMTVHNAKGLEFPVVFLTGLEEEMFPHRLSMENEEGIEEERRLCYVGMTRAKERLFLSTAELRRSFNNVFRMAPSRFLDEIPSSTVKWSSYRSGGSDFSYGRQSAARSFTQKSPGSFTRQKPVAPKKEVPKEESVTGSFSISQKVLHPKYGPGKIISIDGTGDNRKLTIVFAVGKKSFLEKYTPLSPLN
jgi:DNA helicase II / ATP-dependent DNA helicase PcrA